jgi:hypothetical protein
LSFLWTPASGREIRLARLPLQDRSLGWTNQPLPAPEERIVWLDACLDTQAASRAQPYLEEKVPPDQKAQPTLIPEPKLMVWCVTEAPGGLRCWRVNAPDKQVQSAVTLGTPGSSPARVVASAVTHTRELALLLADEQDRLYYASTLRGAVTRLDELARGDITLKQFPSLLAATSRGVQPWVYLRYVADGSAIKHVLLDPASEQDPFEPREAATAAGGMRRR